MEYHPPNIQTRAALDELQQYLSDHLAPLMVADSLGLLLDRPPQLVAVQIQAWTAAQVRFHRAAVPISSYLYHALKKIHVMGEFKLVPREPLAKYLEELSLLIIEHYCPEEERALLRENLALLGQADTSIASTVQALHWPGEGASPQPVGGGGGAAGAPGPALSDEAAKGLRRFSIMLESLARMPQAPTLSAASIPESQGNLISQVLTTAAVSSQSDSELRQYLARLRDVGMEPRTDEVFRVLARSLPGWGIVVPPAATSGGAATGPASGGDGPLEAMHKLITLSEDPEEGATRFALMMQAAIEQFNQGALGAAVAMFDLAQRILDEKKINPGVLKGILHRAHEALDPGRLAKLADKPDKHTFLRRVLAFFPDLTPEGLLDQLEREPRRERRRLLLALLEVHGEPARAAAYQDLRAALAGDRPDLSPYHVRNLIYLLRRIPRPPEQPFEEELDSIVRMTGREYAPIVRKEALALLGHMKHERAEHTLIARAREFEELLLRPGESSIDRGELVLLLDRAIYALSRYGTLRAWRTVVDHALKGQPQLGEPLARIAHLSALDLSEDKETVARLIKALRDQLPLRVLGFAIPRRHDAAVHLIRGLSGTPAPTVHHAFDEIVHRFPDTEFAEAASKALATFGASARPPEQATTTLSGDLELFGLPNLLQSLADSEVSGVLTLTDANGEPVGTLNFEGGRLRDCHVGALHGEAAVYQLFESPKPGSFVLRSRRDGASDAELTQPPMEVLPVILEAVRRHDELRKSRAIVPDELSLKPTGVKPTRLPDEKDANFLRVLWARAAGGATPEQCEASVTADSYRIRALLAHWVEEGSLQAR